MLDDMELSGGSETSSLTTDNTTAEPNPTELHAKWFYVARQLDGATPQPVQKMTHDGLLRFVAKQQRLARQVYTCYKVAKGLLEQKISRADNFSSVLSFDRG